jgi:hypothetical protein
MVRRLHGVGRAHRVRIDPAATRLHDVVEELEVVLVVDARDDLPIRGPKRQLRAICQQTLGLELSVDRHEPARALGVRSGVMTQEYR